MAFVRILMLRSPISTKTAVRWKPSSSGWPIRHPQPSRAALAVWANGSRVGRFLTHSTQATCEIDQIWLPDLTINYNFSQAARFDRCKTCHQDISATAAGTATDPAFPTLPDEKRELTLKMATPDAAPESSDDLEAATRDAYGLVLTNDQPDWLQRPGDWCITYSRGLLVLRQVWNRAM